MMKFSGLVSALILATTGFSIPAFAQTDTGNSTAEKTIRIATFNALLYREEEGRLIKDLKADRHAQIEAVAQIIQTVRPDILLLNEFDYDADHRALDLFQNRWLEQKWGNNDPIGYEYSYTAPSNTGIPTDRDLDRNGKIGGAGDAYGYGDFPGQYGMAVLSRFPIDKDAIRTFQMFLWADMPDARLPDDPETEAAADWYSDDIKEIYRLSSKSHWDLPINIDGQMVHFLVSHPTPPIFDGEEDRNGLRNHDEIRFWADYIRPDKAGYIYDDAGAKGGLETGARFVIAGDLNADPNDGANVPGTIQQLLDHPLIQSQPAPTSEGAKEQARLQGGKNDTHQTPAAQDTSDFKDSGDFSAGNLRLDYVLPSKAGLDAKGAHVFWPESTDPDFALVGTYPYVSSDHRLVWIDVQIK